MWFSLGIIIEAADGTERKDRIRFQSRPQTQSERSVPGGNLNDVPGALSSCKLDKVVIVAPTVPASLLRLHASLAVRSSVFLHREHGDKCFGG